MSRHLSEADEQLIADVAQRLRLADIMIPKDPNAPEIRFADIGRNMIMETEFEVTEANLDELTEFVEAHGGQVRPPSDTSGPEIVTEVQTFEVRPGDSLYVKRPAPGECEPLVEWLFAPTQGPGWNE